MLDAITLMNVAVKRLDLVWQPHEHCYSGIPAEQVEQILLAGVKLGMEYGANKIAVDAMRCRNHNASKYMLQAASDLDEEATTML